MKIDTLGVQAFVAIARQRSFNKAAEELFITQTALSRRLQNLEDSLGVTLVERTTRSVSLTAIGRDFLPQAQRLITDLAAALREIRETGKALRGDVSIACVPTVGVRYLPRIIKDYSARFPDNRIKILDHSSYGVAEAVVRREAEFGINISGASHPDLVSTPLLRDRFVLACRDDHPLAGRPRVPWRQLAQHPLIFAGQASGNRPVLELGLAADNPELHSHYEVQRSSTALGLVAAGVGAAVVPSLAMQASAYPRIRVIALVEPVISRSLVLVRRKTSQLSPAAQALYDLIARKAARPRRGEK